MTMAENESPKLTRKASKARLHKTVSRLYIDAKFKDKQADNEKSSHADKDSKKTKKGKKKDKGKNEIKDERKEGELKKLSWSRTEIRPCLNVDVCGCGDLNAISQFRFDSAADELAEDQFVLISAMGERAAAKRESFRNCVFEKVKAALNTACKDGDIHIDIDNITPLMKCLNITTASESFIDLIRHSIIENSCEVEPLELDALVMKTQEGNVLVDVDECLEAAFNLIDFDNDGYITEPDIKQLLNHLEEDLGHYAVNNMLQTVDTDKDGQISLSEFRHFLLGRDIALEEQTESKAGNIRELWEAKKKEKNKTDNQEVTEGGPTDGGSNMADKNTDGTFSKIRSVVNGLKPRPSTHMPADLSEGDIAAIRDHSLRSIVTSIKEEQQDGDKNDDKVDEDNESEITYSPRKLDSVNRKKLFFGGFINNERHIQPVVFDWLNTDKNDNYDEVETIDGIPEDNSMKPRSSSTAQFQEVNTVSDSNDPLIICDRLSRDIEFVEDIDNYREDNSMKNSRRSSLAKFQEVNRVSDSDDAYIMYDKSSWNSESIEDIDDYMEDRVWDEGPMPLELDTETTHLPPPDLSLFDVSRSIDESPSVISQLQIPRHGETDDVASVSEVEELEIESEKAMVFSSRRETPNLNQTRIQDQPLGSGSVFEDEQARNTMNDVHDFNNGLIFELQSGRKGSNFPQNSIADSNDSGEKSDSITNDDKEGTESDEGIELIDDEVVQRAVRIPLSLQPSSASLRIHLPRGNTVCINHPLEDKTSYTHKTRSQITIDLQDLDVSEQENKKNNTVLNGNERLNSRISKHRPKRETKHEYSGVNFNMNSPNINYSSSEEEENRNVRYQHNLRSNSWESSTTLFSTRSNESVSDSQNDSLTLLNKGGKFHSWGTSQETALAKSQTYDYRKENYLSNPTDNQRITPSSQRKCEPCRTMKFNLKYDKGEKFQDNSVKIAHEVSHLQKSAMTSKDGYHTLAASGKTWEEENMSGVFHNYTLQGRFPSRAHTEKLNPVLYWENSKHVHTKSNSTSKQSEPAKHGNPFPHENNIFAQREQAITIPDPSLRFSTRRSLQRSRTSFELPIVRESEISSKACITDQTKLLPRKRSFSASASRRTATSTTIKPQYTSISVLDLTKTLQTGVSIKNKNNSLANNHYEPSNMIPLSRILNGSQANRYGYHSKLDYSVSRNIDKSGVPYFLHSSKVTKVLPAETKTHQKKKRAKNATKRSDMQDDSCNSEVTTLVGDYKDPDVIPNDVVFDNVSAFTGDLHRR